MSEERPTEYTEFKAPVTGWEILRDARYWILAIALVIIYLFFQPSIPAIFQYAIWTFIGVFLTTYWFLGLPEGWALDTLEMPKGHIGLKPLNRYQLERVQSTCMMFSSDSGPIALVGHKLFALDPEGYPMTHPMIELQTNSEIANRVARIQADMIDKFLLMERNAELVSMDKFAESVRQYRKKARLDPEQS